MIVAVLNIWGIAKAQESKRKCRLWRQLGQVVSRCQTEIRFTADGPEKILTRLFADGEWGKNFPLAKGNYPDYTKRLSQWFAGHYPLNPQEQDSLASFFRQLGSTDLQGQLNLCEKTGYLFEQWQKEAEIAYKTKGVLTRNLCGLASAALAILLI